MKIPGRPLNSEGKRAYTHSSGLKSAIENYDVCYATCTRSYIHQSATVRMVMGFLCVLVVRYYLRQLFYCAISTSWGVTVLKSAYEQYKFYIAIFITLFYKLWS